MAIIKRNRVFVDAPREAPPANLASGTSHEKSARLVRLEGRVVGIEFTCACGERSLIEIDSDDGSESAT